MTTTAEPTSAMLGNHLLPLLDPLPVLSAAPAPVLDLVIPVYNEEIDLEPCVRRLHEHLTSSFPYAFRLTVADNASTDATLAVAQRLAVELPDVTVVHLEEKGRGRALRTVWLASDAAVLAYTDVDLSTDLNALLPLVAPLITGHSDLALGTRLARGSRVVRGTKRELISRSYNLLLRGTLATRFSDAQCGFKAIRADVASRLLPLVEDTGWFFDTELLVLAERVGLRMHEVPVDWVDDPDSRVDIMSTAVADLRGIVRVGRALARGRLPLSDLRAQLARTPMARTPMARTPMARTPLARTPLARTPLEPSSDGVPRGLTRQLVRFAAVGVASTLAYLALFFLLQPGLAAQAANLLALLVTAVANTAANRRFTFGVRGHVKRATHQVQGLAVFLLGLGLTSGSLALVHASGISGRTTEALVLVSANLLATLVRFLLLRGWVFGRPVAPAYQS
jgi:putative flippase GtrA